MLEITISSELGKSHPRCMAGCKERAHREEAFEHSQCVGEGRQTPGAAPADPQPLCDRCDEAPAGRR